jgi:NADPH-dependent 2,4-dienoyl-CoA reductase/sulfur reductase-like enzyme
MDGHVIVIGGGPAGIITALTAKSVYPQKSVRLIKEIGDGVIHLIEMMPQLLFTAFDDAFCDQIVQILLKKGVTLHFGNRVASIDGKQKVESITLQTGVKIPVDMVLVSIGAKPATGLAQDAGLLVVENDSIWVDEYMRTTAEDIFAVGDCALKRDFFTRKPAPVWLASTATAEARNAGTNIYGIRVLHQIQGTIGAFSTQIGGISFASAGMTCRACEKEGFRYVTATASAPDRHPGVLPGAGEMKVKLVFADRSGIILGGQISGGPSAGELINMVALAIQKKVTVRELDMMQIATHPLLTPAPTVHPIIIAAHKVLAKLRSTRIEPVAIERVA